MTDNLLIYGLFALSGLIGISLAGITLWLVGQLKQLRQAQQHLLEISQQNSRDIAALCSAGVNVDSRLTHLEQQLKQTTAKLTSLEQHEQTSQPYHSVIAKIRSGASVETLIKECGLSRDEAVLLTRLHGKSRSS